MLDFKFLSLVILKFSSFCFIYLFYFYYYFYFLNLPIEFVFSLVGKNYEHLFYFFFRKTCVLLGNVY